MTKSNLAILMKQLGYGTGFRLPVASEENRIFEKLLEEQQRVNLEVRSQIEEEKKRKDNLKDHLARISTEVKFTQNILETKKTTLAAEKASSIREQQEENALKKDVAKTKLRVQELQAKNNASVEQLEKRRFWCERQQLKEAKYKVAVDTIKYAIKDKEKGMEYVLDILQIDSKAVQECELKYTKSTEEQAALKQELEKNNLLTQSLQLQFERAVSQLRHVRGERNQRVTMWQNTIESLKNRDDVLQRIADDYREVHKEIRRHNNLLERERLLFDMSRDDSKHAEMQITGLDRRVNEIYKNIKKETDLRGSMSDNLKMYQISTSNRTESIKSVTMKLTALDKEYSTIDHRTTGIAMEVMSLKEKFSANKHTSSIQKIKAMEDLLNDEELRMEKLRHNLESLRHFRWLQNKQMMDLKEQMAEQGCKMNGLKNALRVKRQEAQAGALEIEKQSKAYFELEIRCTLFQRRLEEASAPKQNNNGFLMENLRRSREECSEIEKDVVFLERNVGHLTDCNRKIRSEVDEQLRSRAALMSEAETQRWAANAFTKSLAAALKEHNDARVEYCMVSLHRGRVLKMVNAQRENNYSLEKDRLNLLSTIKQRKSEVDLHLSLLKVKFRAARDEKSKLSSQKSQIMMEVTKRRNCYEILTATMTTSDQKEKQEFSEAYYILKNAQEREAVKREGDIWDQRVTEAEKETTALQNTLAVMKTMNNAFKENLTPALVGTQELERAKQLEHKLFELHVRKQKAGKRIKEIRKDYQEKQSELESVMEMIETLKGSMSDKQYHMNSLLLEISKQKDKISRATRVAIRVQKGLKNQNPSEKSHIEADLKLKFHKEKFSYALKMLDRAIVNHGELKVPVLEYLRQKPGFHDIARHLEKSGKCISVEASQPSTPKQKFRLKMAAPHVEPGRRPSGERQDKNVLAESDSEFKTLYRASEKFSRRASAGKVGSPTPSGSSVKSDVSHGSRGSHTGGGRRSAGSIGSKTKL